MVRRVRADRERHKIMAIVDRHGLSGVDSASGFFSGGRGFGLSEPGSIGSIKCFSCATAEFAAARKRTASRQRAARISNYTSYGSVGNWKQITSMPKLQNWKNQTVDNYWQEGAGGKK
jgi:hypothetical protein